MSRSVELFSDGSFLLRLWVFVGPEGVMGSYFDWQWPETLAPVGSIEMERVLENGVAELAQNLKRGVDVFVEHLPADGGGS